MNPCKNCPGIKSFWCDCDKLHNSWQELKYTLAAGFRIKYKPDYQCRHKENDNEHNRKTG